MVEKGILKSYLNSRETAARLGGVPRNARAEGLDRPVVRMSNTYIANGDWKLEEIFEELGDGVYLAGSRGGQVSTGEGVFQFNAKRGYLVEKGEKTKLLRDVSLSGKILETLLHVKAVGNDLKFNSGRCGKAGQLVPVSDGSPHLLGRRGDGGRSGINFRGLYFSNFPFCYIRMTPAKKRKIESYCGINPFSSAIFWPSAPTTKSIYAFAQDEGSPKVYR